MSQELRVQAPPPKPLLVFDGDCQFCRRWIARWKNATGDAVDYISYQELSEAGRFPELPSDNFAEAVHLILPDGSVSRGAEAVFRSLAEGGRHRWLIGLYRKLPPFADLSELLYEEVALHRTGLSKLDRIYAGPGLQPTNYIWTRFVFLRGLALIYLIAFGSYWLQIDGLVGSHGVFPAQAALTALGQQMTQAQIGVERIFLMPTFSWWSASDASLHWQCGLGLVGAVALLAGIAPTLMLFLLWALYLSLCSVSGPFFSFQWDALLLETGFLAIFFAPLQLWERPSRQARPPALVLWLLRWLLFRLMFESGCVKLMSSDALWWNMSALRVHYQTQPLPTWIGWYAHQLSPSFQTLSVLFMFAVELIVPAFIFAGRRLRLAAACILAVFQILILLTGNYTFFNWLTILLCVPLLDDKALQALAGKSRPATEPAPAVARAARWPWLVTLCLTLVTVPLTMIPFLAAAGARQSWPTPVGWLYHWAQPWRSFNGYGLFAVMTPARPEIIIQGSDDGRNWKDYEFKYKPGDVKRAPGFVAPCQPRLDWQMWFAALDPARNRGWFYHLEYELLQNSPEVLGLMGPNPFPTAPPKYIRALLYEYYFNDRATRRTTGAWWHRDLKGLYAPPLTLEDFRHAQSLAAGS